jgi:hypothetical protein
MIPDDRAEMDDDLPRDDDDDTVANEELPGDDPDDEPLGNTHLFMMLWHFRVRPEDDEPDLTPPCALTPDVMWHSRALVHAGQLQAGVRQRRIKGHIELVHGTLEGGAAYAWVELPAGLVYDPATGQLYRKFDHGIILRTEPRARYTVPNAEALAERHGHAGPWLGDPPSPREAGPPPGRQCSADQVGGANAPTHSI